MFKPCRAVLLAAAVVAAAPALAASVAEDAQALINRGSYAEALRILDAHLARNKQDAEARFTRGLALVKLNRSEEAIKVFADLTRDYPQLPEPYNNLAVLYAQQGDYEKARDALEAALATHPSYATAHENLGDIYAALAGAAYNRALMLDQGNAIVRRKLSLINQLDSAPADGSTVAVAPPRSTPPAAAAPAAPPAVAAAPTPIAPAPAPAPAPAVTAPPPVTPAAPATASIDAATTQAAEAAVQAWARAWQTKDLDAYFGAYAPGFAPEGGLTRGAWETQRRDRISRPKRISVKAENLQFARIDNGRVRATFTQAYESDAFSDSVTKVLELEQSGGTWKIVREYTR